jgi:hypothetical protein
MNGWRRCAVRWSVSGEAARRSSTVRLTNPTAQTVVNNQYNADGTLDSARLLPTNAGFGAVTRANAMRSLQFQARFQF